MDVKEVRIAVMAADYERSVRFYRETLGLDEVLETWESHSARGILLRVRDGVVLEIIAPGGGETPGAISLALKLDGPAEVDRRYESLLTAGVETENPPADKPWGERSFAARDPDGNVVRLYASIPHIAD